MRRDVVGFDIGPCVRCGDTRIVRMVAMQWDDGSRNVLDASLFAFTCGVCEADVLIAVARDAAAEFGADEVPCWKGKP